MATPREDARLIAVQVVPSLWIPARAFTFYACRCDFGFKLFGGVDCIVSQVLGLFAFANHYLLYLDRPSGPRLIVLYTYQRIP